MNYLKNCVFVSCFYFVFFSTSLLATPSVSGEFKQLKYFSGFSKPFISKGEFTLEGEKLLWHVKTPAQSTLLIEDGQVFVKNKGGELTHQPGSEQFVGLLTDLLALNMEALRTRFDVSNQGDCLLLKPKDAMLKQLFSHFILCENNERVESVTLNEHSGSSTQIDFSYANTSNN
ncbi:MULTISPECIES: outer membrane lipoprotein carrier protein LolA [unclassified Pseudoalteromonas]|jgi:hypothetical protein|uniref:outer membrane lipoprotein carrier protein LolA n=1 Tax=unclassified Pseudoalteromonas TaxID=194690 RepID=UPI002572FC09|nr:outer membrane lipoprotein carrier protein LolA [Pseudoalteromonas sp. MM1]